MLEQVYEYHPFADAFPMMTDQEYRELVADIKARGQHEPIVRYQGKILDGRNRYKACRELGIKPIYNDFEGDDAAALAFVISMNLMRRHQDETGRAMSAARLATLRSGQRADQVQGLPIGRAAKMFNVGERTAARAKKVIQKGSPELVAAIDRGEITVSAAEKQIQDTPKKPGNGDLFDDDSGENDEDDPIIADEDEGDEDVEDIVGDLGRRAMDVAESAAPLSYSFKRSDGSVATYLREPETIDDAVKLLMQVKTAEAWRTVFPGDDLHRLVDLGDHVRMLVATGSPASSKPKAKKVAKNKKPPAKAKSKTRTKKTQGSGM
jgi:ParB-like chromosome segregation protein Spo0J